MPLDALDSLVESLRESGLLTLAQVAEVRATLSLRSAEPAGLCQEFVRRGWLTPFQAERAAAGRARDLTLGPYLLLDRLGVGGMGEVFKARHTLMGRVVALKVIRADRLAGADAVDRFRREIRAAARVSHPNVVTAHDAAQVGDLHFYVMEYLEGTDLARVVKEAGPLPVGLACEYIRQAALGLQHAHEQGLVHRDVKPGNLMLVGGPSAPGVLVKVLDLGLARVRAADAAAGDLTRDGAVLGTPDYLAPEQADDARAADIRADVYSLGCTLYHLLTGKPPFPGGNLLAKLTKHREIDPVPPDVIRPEVPAGVAAVVQRMMAKRPEDRYQTPAEVASALAPFAADAHAARPVPVGRPSAAPAAAPSTFNQSRAESAVDRTGPRHPTPEAIFGAMVAESEATTGSTHRPAAGGGRPGPRRRWLIAAGFLGAAVVVAAGVLFFARLKGGDGKTEIEILTRVDVDLNDKSLSFTLDDKPVTADELRKPVELTVGRHVFEVRRGAEVQRRVVFRVSQDAGGRFEVEEDARPARPQPRPKNPPASPPDPDRAVAEWVLGKGGTVTVAAPANLPKTLEELAALPEIKSPDALPTIRFRLVGALFPKGGCIDDDLARFDNVRLLSLHLGDCPVTDRGLERLAGQTELLDLFLEGTRTTDAGLRHLTRMTKLIRITGSPAMTGRGFASLPAASLRSVHMLSSAVTNDGLAELALLPTLANLWAAGGEITDAGVAHLARTKLKRLNLQAPALTDAGVAHLARIRTLTMLELNRSPHITDAGLQHIGGMTQLIWLYLMGSEKITIEGVIRLKPLTNLQVLHLRSPHLTDDVYEHLTGFKNLYQLSLGRGLTGAGLHHLKSLPKLRLLFLESNSLTDEGFASMPPLTGLTTLTIGNSPKLTDKSLPRLKALTGLTRLEVNGRFSPAGVKELQAALPGCRVFWARSGEEPNPEGEPPADADRAVAEWVLGKGGAVGLAVGGKLPAVFAELAGLRFVAKAEDLPRDPFRLARVDLTHGRCRDDDLKRFAGVPLTSLAVYTNPITDRGLRELAGHRDMLGLQLNGTQITDDGLAHLAGMRRLEVLHVSGTRVTGVGLRHLRGLPLKMLEIGGPALTDAGLGEVAALTGIDNLGIADAGVTDDGFRKLRPLNPYRLLLTAPNLTDGGLRTIRGFDRLGVLELYGPKLTDDGLKDLGGLRNLRTLVLFKTDVTDAGLEYLAAFPALASLQLGGPKFTDAGLRHLAGLKGLRDLRLRQTGVGDGGVETLSGMRSLTYLDLTDSKVTPAGLKRLRDALPGCQVLP